MTMRVDFAEGTGSSGFFGIPYLRIAVPSWRFVGIHRVPDEKPALSREEIVRLFDGELNPRRKRKLTDHEEAEKRLASRIRGALYEERKA